MQFGPKNVIGNVCIMDDLPFDFILGWDAMVEHKGCVDPAAGGLRLTIQGQDILVPFVTAMSATKAPVLVAENATIRPGEECFVLARCDLDAPRRRDMDESRRWGIVKAADPASSLQVAQGITRVDAKDPLFRIKLMNIGDDPIVLTSGEPVGLFNSSDLDLHSLVAASRAPPASAASSFPTFTRSQVDAMEGPQLDKAISGLPHLRDLT